MACIIASCLDNTPMDKVLGGAAERPLKIAQPPPETLFGRQSSGGRECSLKLLCKEHLVSKERVSVSEAAEFHTHPCNPVISNKGG